MAHGNDAYASHLTNAFWYLDNGDLWTYDTIAADAKKKVFIKRLNRIKQSKVVQIYGPIHSDICNVNLYLVPDVRMKIKLTKAKTSFCLMNKDAESKTIFKFLDSQLLVNRVKPSPSLVLGHNTALEKTISHARISTWDGLKSSTFSGEAQSFSIDKPYWDPSQNNVYSPW